MREWINICEAFDIEHLRLMVDKFRQAMENEPTDTKKPAYMRFFGQCNSRSRALVDYLHHNGFPEAKLRYGAYRIDDPRFPELHGGGVSGWEEGEWDEFPDEDHEFVEVGSYYVDVTADQFHPSNPDDYRVVVVPKMGRHPYR